MSLVAKEFDSFFRNVALAQCFDVFMISGARKESLEIDRIPLARATFKEMLL